VYRVFVADDHPLFRSGLKQLLSQEHDLAVEGEAEHPDDVLRAIAEQDWDIVILDLSLPDRSGFDLLREIRRLRPELPVLILSMHPEDQFAVRAIKAGASGYLSKGSAASEVIGAVRKVLSGKKYVSANLAELLANSLNFGLERPLHDALSEREFLVMREIASGKTVSQIASEIALSVKTVSTYRSRVLEKMNMRNNAELTRYAIQNGLVD
jgi:DNA-binding NarL/FixJ family response regulator